MSKKIFALKLISPGPTFAQDMNDGERSVMQEHVGFWMELMKQGTVVVVGPIVNAQS